MFRKAARIGYLAGWAVLALGLLLQYGLKDQVFGLRLLFYAMPKPCLLALAVTLLVWPKAGLKPRLASAAVAAFLAWSWTSVSWRSGPPEVVGHDEKEEVRVLFWNLCRPKGIHQGLVEMMQEFQPHFAACVEPGRDNMEEHCRTYESLLPGYKVEWMPRGILWLSKVPSRYRDRGKLEGIGAYARFVVNGLGDPFQVVVADVHPHPLHWRKGQLDDALSYAEGSPDALLMGDFNTPLESALLEGYRAQYTHALEAAGQGFKETWPVGLPLLSLDHFWLGQNWEALNARKIWRLDQSDHAALLVTLRRRN